MRDHGLDVWLNITQLAEKLWVYHERWRVGCTTENKNYWYNVLSVLAWQAYADSGHESTRLWNIMNCAEIATDVKYKKTVLGR